VGSDSISYPASLGPSRLSSLSLTAIRRRLLARPELLGLMGLAAVLNLWGLGVNGWANTYYSAAVRSMTTSWHNFLFASLDQSGLMTVDKPPLGLWVQALSARVFGLHPLSLLVPQALMGVAATALIYDLTLRRFGRPAGFAAGFALATTPIIVAVSRHNNPDELLTLCSIAAIWCTIRALETGRPRWLVLTGVLVGLGFETKMGVALMVVPGIAAAHLWVGPRGRLAALRQLVAGGIALAAVGLAWPVLATLTPVADRPWISGTADNSVWSLIFSYNGVGRIAGQTGGPSAFGGGGGGGTGGLFDGSTGAFRLLGSSLGDQAGWLLGFALVAGLGVLVSSRLRQSDPRTGWLIAVGGAFLTSAAVFSFASGIFHPYYVSLVAPFASALIGAGVGQALSTRRSARVLAPLAIGAGVVTELIVLGTVGGELSWAQPLVIAVGGVGAIALAFRLLARVRAVALAIVLAALFAGPVTWAAETVGHTTSGTFPSGGPVSAETDGFGGAPGGPGGGAPPGVGAPSGVGARPGTLSPGAQGLRSPFGPGPSPGLGGLGGRPFGAGFGGPPGFGGDSATLEAAIKYSKARGGGTIGVSSQSNASAAILGSHVNVAGLGGFSGRESSVTVAWIAMEVQSGHLRWLIAGASQRVPSTGDPRQGSRAAMKTVARACPAVSVKSSADTSTKLYDCQGRAAAILGAAAKS